MKYVRIITFVMNDPLLKFQKGLAQKPPGDNHNRLNSLSESCCVVFKSSVKLRPSPTGQTMDTSEEGTTPQLKEFLLAFMPEKCYDQFFLHFNFIHGEGSFYIS